MTNLDIQNAYVGITQADKIYLGDELIWPTTTPEPEYSGVPLTFEILNSGTISYESDYEELSATSKYSINDGPYSTLASAWTVNVQPGDKVSVIGDCPFVDNQTWKYFGFSESSAVFNLYGNAMSLLTENYASATSFSGLGHFGNSFMNTKVVDASNLVLPVLDLSSHSYCYVQMFYACTGLTAAPKLPATAISEYCYTSMFRGCTSLRVSPVLPAQTPKEGCYIYMFDGCHNLSAITCLLTSLGDFEDPSTQNWTQDVGAGGTFYKAPGVTWPSGADGIPTGWTVIDADI